MKAPRGYVRPSARTGAREAESLKPSPSSASTSAAAPVAMEFRQLALHERALQLGIGLEHAFRDAALRLIQVDDVAACRKRARAPRATTQVVVREARSEWLPQA